MSKRPTILVMAGGDWVGHIFPAFFVAENLQVFNGGRK